MELLPWLYFARLKRFPESLTQRKKAADTNGLYYYEEPEKQRYEPSDRTNRDSGTEVDRGPDSMRSTRSVLNLFDSHNSATVSKTGK